MSTFLYNPARFGEFLNYTLVIPAKEAVSQFKKALNSARHAGLDPASSSVIL